MNDQLQAALLAMLGKTVNAVGAGVDLLSAELPEVIRQLLLWRATESFMFFIVGLALMFFTARNVRRFYAMTQTDNSYDIDPHFACIGCVMGFLVGICMSLCCLDWLQILIAPKVYLVEYVARIARH